MTSAPAFVTKLFRQVRSKAREIDGLLNSLNEHFPSKECASQLHFTENLKRWRRLTGAPKLANPSSLIEKPTFDSVRELIGDEGDTKDIDPSLGFEMIREMSRHKHGVQIALEWGELVKQSISSDNISDVDLIGIERGALLADRVGLLCDEDAAAELKTYLEDKEPLFGSQYQSSGMHPLDRATMDHLDEIVEIVKSRLKAMKQETGKEVTEPDILEQVRSTLFDDLKFVVAMPIEQSQNMVHNRIKGVLKTRCGSPIPLGILYATICSRLGLNVRVVKLPNAFLLRITYSQGEPAPERKIPLDKPEDIKQGASIEVYWNGDDKWYPAKVISVNESNITVAYWDKDQRHTELDMKNLNATPDLNKDTLVFRVLKAQEADPKDLTIGRRIEVFWTVDQCWYPATVSVKDEDQKKVSVQYDDGDKRNTELSLDYFGAAPVKLSQVNVADPGVDETEVRETSQEEGRGKEDEKLVFRLFERPFAEEDRNSCFVDPARNGRRLGYADVAGVMRETGLPAAKFKSFLTPTSNPHVWMMLLKFNLRIATTNNHEEKTIWSNQVMDLSKLEKAYKNSWKPEDGSGSSETEKSQD
ncbi:hypothetical protein AAMO2058_000740000 [Amorphochlora amoebiformis]